MKNTSEVSNESALFAIEKFLVSRGYEIIRRKYSDLVDFICRDGEDRLLFIAAFVSDGVNSEGEEVSRAVAEYDMFTYLVEHGITSTLDVRFDAVSLFIAGENKALLRYHIGCL